MDAHGTRQTTEGLMVFMASLSHGLEQVLGRGAAPVTFRAGRTVGLKADLATRPDLPLEDAVALVRRELGTRGINWELELWKPTSATSHFYEKEGKKAAKLVFRNCMVRCSLFRYSHEQKLSLCMMNHGLFCGFLQKITGQRADLEILHAGESACLKELTLTPGGGRS